ncbi:ornithine cyclodeaminase family protein [Candidatus Poribacteria bacterium]|nr:ornithine cyclodeaminase family protein [Candidatus Poribacteria bacterium]
MEYYMKSLLYLSYENVASVGLLMSEIIDTVEDAFLQKGLGKVEVPPKPGIHTQPDAFIHAMPAYIPELRAAGMKWVAGYPENYKRGLPYISGLLIMNDPETGFPLCVMDCTWITAKRTGTATAVAAKYLARKDSKSLGILGCGVQGRSNLEALKVVFPEIDLVKAYDIAPENLARYIAEMQAQFDIKVMGVDSPQEAVVDSDIIVTAGPILKNPNPVIEVEWLKPGCFACPLDFDSYFKPEAFLTADKLYTDDLAQQQYYKQAGYFQQTPEPKGDLGEVVAGRKPARQSDSERIISINLGLALEDVAVGIKIYQRATEKGIGKKLPL